ncbi:septal ring lytic transglycosylase RlpA family protein [Methylobacterium sp. Leaf113]|uniref:septal ring lytic transglycosylase RlpA family protein n=1 Tax=Methylobacterium sp. Leaf113 TaxID=1736259 RepID=UPI0009E74BB4|nr:septal ring lytic transglycosylase RlpA family protein [Methylobacterium sp. Leaf113]
MARRTKPEHQDPAPLPLWRLLAVSAVALATANCAQNPQKLAGASGSGSALDPKYGVKASPRLYNEGDVIPKGGGRRFSGKPYVVAGRTYVPRDDAKGYVREGLASWYGSAFHGRMTANGEVFDRHSIAAAHPTLPLPSYARVTNLANGHSMIVRVNDRGPYHANRLMDVSEEVAEALEFRRSGTARVRVEYAGKASTAGSDDRKLLATLRTDGQPARVHGQGPVMMADLGPDAPQVPSERLARASQPALAFKADSDRDAAPEASEEAVPAPRPVRSAPVLMASAATVAVPAALQPTAARAEAFRPVRHNLPEPQAGMTQAASRPSPLSLTPPPLRLAGARPEPVRSGTAGGSRVATVQSGRVAATARMAAAGSSPAGHAVAPARLAGQGMAGLAPKAGGSRAPAVQVASLKAGSSSRPGLGAQSDAGHRSGPTPKAIVVAKVSAQVSAQVSAKVSAEAARSAPGGGKALASGPNASGTKVASGPKLASGAKVVSGGKVVSGTKAVSVGKPALVAKASARARFAEAR